MFNGPEGKLEAKYVASAERNAPAVLFLHPHPLHGGTMNNKVIYNSFYTMHQDLGFSALRFNFRGCGKSQGSFDHGIGELADAAAALDLLQELQGDASSYWLAGFSFGAWIALQLLMRRPEINGFIAISPPAHSYDFNFLSPCPAPGLIIQGTSDKIVPEEAVFSFYQRISKQKNSEVEYTSISGADHFFKDHMPALRQAIIAYLKPRIKMEAAPVKMKRDRRRRQNADEA